MCGMYECVVCAAVRRRRNEQENQSKRARERASLSAETHVIQQLQRALQDLFPLLPPNSDGKRQCKSKASIVQFAAEYIGSVKRNELNSKDTRDHAITVRTATGNHLMTRINITNGTGTTEHLHTAAQVHHHDGAPSPLESR